MIKRILLIGPANSAHLLKIHQALTQNDCDVLTITQHAPSQETQIKYIQLKHFLGLGYLFNWIQLQRLANEFKPDLVFTNYATGYGFLSHRLKFKKILSVWGSDILIFPQKSFLHKFFIKYVLSHYPLLHAPSDILINEVSLLSKPQKIYKIPFGINTQLFSFKKNYQQRDYIIGTCRSMKDIYGIDLLIKAFAKVLPEIPYLKLEIVGEGPQLEEYKTLTNNLNLQTHITFLGPLKNDLLPAKLNEWRLFINPSRSESFGVAALEANACGVPVIASTVGGLNEIIQNGINGFKVKLDTISLSQKIVEMIQHPSEELSQTSIKHVTENYSFDKMKVSIKLLLMELSQ